MRNLLASALLFFLLQPASAEPWTQKGTQWSHPRGCTVEVPKETKVESDDNDDSIEITGVSDDFFVGGHFTMDKADAEARVSHLNKSMEDAKSVWTDANANNENFSMVAKNGVGTINGKNAQFAIGYLTKNGKYLVFLTTFNSDDKEKLTPLVQTMLQSVRFPTPEK